MKNSFESLIDFWLIVLNAVLLFLLIAAVTIALTLVWSISNAFGGAAASLISVVAQ